MSVLDMFASALGAFIMCSIILLPYYGKNVKQELTSTTNKLKQAKTKANDIESKLVITKNEIIIQKKELQRSRETQLELNECKEGLNTCQAELAKTFLMIQIEWEKGADVNLQVTDPAGDQFSWDKTNRTGRDFPNSKAQLSTDVGVGPGVEVWLDPAATSGEYKVEYVLPRDPDTDVAVSGAAFDRYGKKPLPPATLSAGKLRVRAATIQINTDGTITLH